MQGEDFEKCQAPDIIQILSAETNSDQKTVQFAPLAMIQKNMTPHFLWLRFNMRLNLPKVAHLAKVVRTMLSFGIFMLLCRSFFERIWWDGYLIKTENG